MKKLWNKFTDNFGTTLIHPQFIMRRLTYEAIIEAKKYATGNLIDIGCGRMPYRRDLEPFLQSYIGVDRKKTLKLTSGDKKPDVLADAKNLPFPPNTFDIALMLQVLEYLDSPQIAIKEANRVIKRGGIVILSSPFLYPIHDVPFDKQRLTDTAIRDIFTSSGFKIVKSVSQGNFCDFWFQSLNVYLMKRLDDFISSHSNILSFIFVIFVVFFILIIVPIVLITNIIASIISFVNKFYPEQKSYFPLNYLVVAQKVKSLELLN